MSWTRKRAWWQAPIISISTLMGAIGVGAFATAAALKYKRGTAHIMKTSVDEVSTLMVRESTYECYNLRKMKERGEPLSAEQQLTLELAEKAAIPLQLKLDALPKEEYDTPLGKALKLEHDKAVMDVVYERVMASKRESPWSREQAQAMAIRANMRD